jgi:fermentation-respiration switch protein FrsA (DUF1100 family)
MWARRKRRASSTALDAAASDALESRTPTAYARAMRIDVVFESEGTTCRGWLYVPTGRAPGGRVPAVVMAHGFSAVKEMRLDRFAGAFARAGEPKRLVVLPVGHFDPYEEPCVADAAGAAVDWCATHLGRAA